MRVSEQEKVVGITSYEGLSVFLLVFACLDGFTRSCRIFFVLGLLRIGWVKSCGDRVEGVGVESAVRYVLSIVLRVSLCPFRVV